jgi:hypothetical protein
MDSVAFYQLSRLVTKPQFLGISLEVWLTVLISSFTVAFSILYNNFRENSRTFRRMKNREEYIFWLSDYLSKILTFQVKEIEIFVEKLATHTLGTKVLNGEPMFSLSLLDDAVDQDTFLALRTCRKTTPENAIQFYTALQHSFGNLKLVYRGLSMSFMEFKESTCADTDPLNAHLAEMQSYHDMLLKASRDPGPEFAANARVFGEFDALVKSWNMNDTLEATLTKFIEPLIIVGSKYADLTLLENARAAKSHIESLIEKLEYYTVFYTNLLGSTKVVIEFLQKDVVAFSRLQPRSNWWDRWF